MTASYDDKIETNRDAWQAVHDGIRDGLTIGEISTRTGMSYQIIVYYRRLDRPASTLRRIQRSSIGMHRCEDCGRARTHHNNKRCQSCESRRMQVESHDPARIETLRPWAIRHGRVPTVNEAHEILPLSRGRAGDMVILAFGKDERTGSQRRVSYRGWPEGAPDVPRPEQVALMRECGLSAGKANLVAGWNRAR